jgi:hypothetical protein
MDNPQVIIRNDLLALKSNPVGYIADKVLPPLRVFQKSGSRNAAVPVTASTAQSGRAAAGAITNVGTLSSNLVTFTTSEILKRMRIDQAERAMFGSQEEYEAVLAWTGTKQVRDAIETKVATVTANASSPTDVSSTKFTGILNAVQNVRPYGRVGIAGHIQAFNTVRAYPEVIDRMKATGVPLQGLDTRSISAANLAAIFTADEIFEANTDTTIWNTNRLYVFVIPDPSVDPAGTPQVGRRHLYTFTGADGSLQTMTCEQMWDPSVRAEVLDFVVYDEAAIYNTTFDAHLSLDGA